MFPDGAINRDLTVLALPLAAGRARAGALHHDRRPVGGDRHDRGRQPGAGDHHLQRSRHAALAAAQGDPAQPAAEGDIGALALWVRRLSIFGVLALGFAYERLTSETALVSIGLLSFAAVAQIAPAFLGGLFWRRGTARGALAGMTAGSLAWLYLLFLPSLGPQRRSPPSGARAAGDRLAEPGLAGRPSPRTRWSAASSISLAVNVVAFVVFSLTRQPTALERTQANAFAGVGGKPQAFRLWRSSTTAGEIEAAVARYLGAARARRAFVRLHARARPGLRSGPGGERPADPARGVSAFARHRRLDLAAGAVAAPAAANRLGPVGAEADRRGLGGDPVEPRPVAARARPRPPGHHGVRFEPRADRLEPRVRRPVRPAAGAAAPRRRARRDRPLQRRPAAPTVRAIPRTSSPSAWRRCSTTTSRPA